MNDNVFDVSDYAGYFEVSADEVGEIPVEDSGTDTSPPNDIKQPATDAGISASDIEQPATDTGQPVSDIETPSPEMKTLPDIINESSQETATEPVTYTVQLDDVNMHLKNIENLSIVLLLAIGLLIGIQVCRILLDRLWR